MAREAIRVEGADGERFLIFETAKACSAGEGKEEPRLPRRIEVGITKRIIEGGHTCVKERCRLGENVVVVTIREREMTFSCRGCCIGGWGGFSVRKKLFLGSGRMQ